MILNTAHIVNKCLVLSIVFTVGASSAFASSLVEIQKKIWSSDCPHNCAAEKSQILDELQNGEILKVEDFAGRIGEYPKRAFFKSGARALLKIEEPYFSVQQSEVLAYRIDQLFNLNLTPTTVLRQVDGKTTSLQLFVDGLEDASSRKMVRADAPQEILVFDYLTRNFDRHTGNWMYFKGEDRPVAVDNDQSFSLYIFTDIRKKFPEPMQPVLSRAQYKVFCSVGLSQIQETVSTIFEDEILQKVTAGIDNSRKDLIRLFEEKSDVKNSCLP